MKRCASTAAKPIEFQRAVRAELAKFDQRTKVCTMNCGPHRDDPRDAKERKYLCGDCMAIEVPNLNSTTPPVRE